jgi:hypothetical protein
VRHCTAARATPTGKILCSCQRSSHPRSRAAPARGRPAAATRCTRLPSTAPPATPEPPDAFDRPARRLRPARAPRRDEPRPEPAGAGRGVVGRLRADPIQRLVARLDLARYKATIKSLTEFGDRRQGTARNRAALDWIEARLRSYGCTNTERMTYQYAPPPPPPAGTPAPTRDPRVAQGGGRPRGVRAPTGVNTDSLKQPDARLRALNAEPSTPGRRQQVYCTKVGTTRPDEMYIVGAHMDGIGWGEAANDDGSGTALVMEVARVLSSPDVRTERSIRFVLWNNEETGLNGARAYVAQRQALQGKESPAGSGRYPEPSWLGMIQHDMMLFDHGMPRPDGTLSPEQRPEADVNVEFQVASTRAAESQALAWHFQRANEKYATDYPVAVGQPHDEHRLRPLPGPRARDQPARERARHAGGQRVGPALAPAHRPLRDLQRQGLPPRPQRGPDHPRRGEPARGSDAGEVSRAGARRRLSARGR